MRQRVHRPNEGPQGLRWRCGVSPPFYPVRAALSGLGRCELLEDVLQHLAFLIDLKAQL